MVYRYSWIAGFASLAFAFWQLNNLLRPTVDGPAWQLIVLAGLALGIVITWTALAYRLSTVWVILLNAVAVFVAVVRYIAPKATLLVLPTGESLRILDVELGRAFGVIRNGVEPVIPIPGLVVIVTVLFWALGALLVWGLTKGHPFVGLLPPVVIALQLATVDRVPTGLAQVGAFVILIAGNIVAVNVDERDQGAGRMARPGAWPAAGRRRPSPTATALLGVAVVASVLTVGLVRSAVPASGVIDWRTSSGLTGGYYGSISFNPFVSIQKGLVSQTRTPVFQADVDGDVDLSELYFRLLTLESYSGGQWFASDPRVFPLEDRPWEIEGMEFGGPTAPVSTDVTIFALEMDWVPAPYAPIDAASEVRSVEGNLRVRHDDASLRYDGGFTYPGMEYSIEAEVPDPDLGVLATASGGGLSPLFVTAAAAGEAVPLPRAVEPLELPNEERYLDLPEDLDPRIEQKARELTARLSTPFEKALALEKWFKESGGFIYDITVTQGHSADALAAWLFDEEQADHYRRGYCEQFATSLGVMARTIDIPSRVVLGFTPGEASGPNTVVVLDNNAHAWVELWMPTQGWVPFDATPRSDEVNPATYGNVEDDLGFALTAYLEQIPEPPLPSITGPVGPIRSPDEGIDPGVALPPGGVGTGGFRLPSWLAGILLLIPATLLLMAAVPVVKWLRRRRRMRRLERGDISAAWEEIVARLTDLGDAPHPAHTPVEVAAGVDDAMTPLARVYTLSVYGPDGAIAESHVRAASDSLQLTTARLTTRYSSLQRVQSWYRLGTLRPRRLRLRRKPRQD